MNEPAVTPFKTEEKLGLPEDRTDECVLSEPGIDLVADWCPHIECSDWTAEETLTEEVHESAP